MRRLMIIFIILVSLSLNAQRSTFGFYKIGVCKVDAKEFYPIGDTLYTLINGEIRFVGNYVTFDYGNEDERFYTITETTKDGDDHTHILWNTRETLVACWTTNGTTMVIISTEPDNKFDSILTVVIFHLTKRTMYRGNNKYPKKGEVKIKPPKKKENQNLDYY